MRDWTGYQLILPSIPDKGIRGPSRVQHLPPFVMRHMRGLGFLQTSAICIIWRMDGKWQYPFTLFSFLAEYLDLPRSWSWGGKLLLILF